MRCIGAEVLRFRWCRGERGDNINFKFKVQSSLWVLLDDGLPLLRLHIKYKTGSFHPRTIQQDCS